MAVHEKTLIQKAILDDLRARKYVLLEQLRESKTCEEYLRIFNQLDAVDHRIECYKTRVKLKDRDELLLRYRRDRIIKTVSITVTHR